MFPGCVATYASDRETINLTGVKTNCGFRPNGGEVFLKGFDARTSLKFEIRKKSLSATREGKMRAFWRAFREITRLSAAVYAYGIELS